MQTATASLAIPFRLCRFDNGTINLLLENNNEPISNFVSADGQ